MSTVATVRVLMADTDAMGIVYHATYLRWFELGRSELVREAGLPYVKMEEMGYGLPVVDLRCRYRSAARYDDILSIEAWVALLTRASVTFGYRIRRGPDGLLLCDGETKHACTDGAGRVRRFPEAVLRYLERAPRS